MANSGQNRDCRRQYPKFYDSENCCIAFSRMNFLLFSSDGFPCYVTEWF